MSNKKELFMVSKLSTMIEYTNPITGLPCSDKLGGLYGFLPVFENREEAESHSENGKFSIFTMSVDLPVTS
jgi:hypothetical protein